MFSPFVHLHIVQRHLSLQISVTIQEPRLSQLVERSATANKRLENIVGSVVTMLKHVETRHVGICKVQVNAMLKNRKTKITKIIVRDDLNILIILGLILNCEAFSNFFEVN